MRHSLPVSIALAAALLICASAPVTAQHLPATGLESGRV